MQAFFLPVDGKRSTQRFCIHHPPGADHGRVRGSLLYVHPFGEEMNKSRRMAALQSRAFARSGYAVLQIDLLGCGDSSGDFADATWDDWVADVVVGADWLRERHDAPLWLWGLRAGCLLAAEAAARLSSPCQHLYWQPVTAGKVQLQQFLRLKLAGNMLEGKSQGAMDGLRDELAAGRPVEIAGYRVSAALARGLEQAQLLPPINAMRHAWLETSTRADATPLPATQAAAASWRAAGHTLSAITVTGPAFWQTQEIEEAPALIAATTAALQAAAEFA